ncbi:MAG: penicillin acylase family protein [Chitinophagaceae bacterium]
MKQPLYIILLFLIACSSSQQKEIPKQYKEQAKRVTIVRDRWGIPHIYGKTDADAVFGLMYAQCEESFERVERNYIDKLGRLSEIEGESYLYHDLQMRLLYDTTAAIADYNNSPPWLKKLLQAFSDGIHYYLAKNPEVKPLLLERFEPWYPLLFTDGAYIDTKTGGLQMEDMKNLFGEYLPAGVSALQPSSWFQQESTGSNGFAVAPSRSASKNALLYINPHVAFYFRTEVHMVSEEGLNTYGAVTWGQFFIFQGFNEHCGWMHTTSMADVSDLYEEKIIKKDPDLFYEYDGKLMPLTKKQIQLKYLSATNISSASVTAYATHHGPIVGIRNNKWLALKAQNRSLQGLIQSWQRTKAKDLAGFTRTMELRANNFTNTMYADDKGNIAYWHGNFIPKRNTSYDASLPLDGSTSITEWQGLHDLKEIVHVINPKEGWLQNCNSSPFSVSGVNSISKDIYPLYMAPEGENFRSLFAIKQLSAQNDLTPEKLIAIGYDHYLAAFDSLLPPLFKDFAALPVTDPFFSSLKEAVDSLRYWDKRSSVTSVATTIGIFWAYQIVSNRRPDVPKNVINDLVKMITWYINHHSAQEKFEALQAVLTGLEKSYGTWKVAWGDINRFQRITGGVRARFDVAKNSLPVGLGPAFLGSLPAYETIWQDSKMYGVGGNSFVAVVEFVRKDSFGGKKIKAKSIVAGGKSFDPESKHFFDQSQMFIEGKLKDVYFYKEDILKNAERTYHPGEK